MVLCDLVQRFLIGPLVWLIPSSRKRVLGAWMQAMAWLTSRPMVFLGGASIAPPPQVPFESGVRIIMNHQSLLDIPMVCTSVRGGYPLIVTRKRYRRWIPLISHMIRLYQYPVVDPTANRRDTLGMTDNLSEVARTAEVPVAIFQRGPGRRMAISVGSRKRGSGGSFRLVPGRSMYLLETASGNMRSSRIFLVA